MTQQPNTNIPAQLQVPLTLAPGASSIQPEEFQSKLIENIAQALLSKPTPPCLLRAPTGAGKTYVIGQVLTRVSERERVVWFWFVPFVNLVSQTLDSILAHAPALRPAQLSVGRNQTLQPGAVLISTAQGVARAQARNKGYDNDSDDTVRSLAATVARARVEGMRIGLIVDEAHIGLDKGTEFGHFAHWLNPDFLLMATATPKDDRLTEFLAKAGYSAQMDFAVSRDEVVLARLNKQYIEAVIYSLGSTMQQVTDLQRTVLRQAWGRNLLIGQHLEHLGVTCVPLLLVQVANGETTVEDAERELIQQCHVPPAAIGKHSADEPNPELMAAIANDTTKRVLIFKQSAGTGFDAPRAFVLASTKNVNDPDFAMQFVGRVMRVTRQIRDAFPRPTPIPAELNTAYVYLANAQAQAGFEAAVKATSSVQTDLTGQIGRLDVRKTASGAVVITNTPIHTPPLDYRFGLPPTAAPRDTDSGSSAATTDGTSAGPQAAFPFQSAGPGAAQPGHDLFGDPTFVIDTTLAPQGSSTASGPLRTRQDVLSALGENRMQVFHRKLDLPTLGVALKTEVKPEMVNLSAIARQIATDLVISPMLEHTAVNAALNRVTQKEVHKELTEGQSYHQMIQVVTNRAALAREARHALESLPHVEDEDYRIIIKTLSERLLAAVVKALAEPSDAPTPALTNEQLARDAAHWVVRESVQDLYEAIFKAIADQATLTEAASLPDLMIFPTDITLEHSAKNIYGVMPPSAQQSQDVESVMFMEERLWWSDKLYELQDGQTLSVGRFDGWLKLNVPEGDFARAIDDAEFVHWWHRNPEKKPYAVRVVRADHHHYFYPDFVICVAHEPGHPPMQRLLETKFDTKDAARKSRHFPPAYGKVLFLTEDHGRLHWVRDDGSLGEVVKLSDMGTVLQKLRETQPLPQSQQQGD